MPFTANQRAKVRGLATIAHEQRMRVTGLLRVKDEALRFKAGLARSMEDAKRIVDRLYPNFLALEDAHRRGRADDKDLEIQGAPYRKAKAALDDLQGQMIEARADLDRLHERIDEENAKAAPSGQLVDRILRHARISRAELGIDFAESDSDISATVALANATPARAIPRSAGGAM